MLDRMVETARGHANVLLALQKSGEFTTAEIIEHLPAVTAALVPVTTDPLRLGVVQ